MMDAGLSEVDTPKTGEASAMDIEEGDKTEEIEGGPTRIEVG